MKKLYAKQKYHYKFLISGAAAILLSQNSTLTPAQISAKLKELSTPGRVKNAGLGSPNRLLYIGREGEVRADDN